MEFLLSSDSHKQNIYGFFLDRGAFPFLILTLLITGAFSYVVSMV